MSTNIRSEIRTQQFGTLVEIAIGWAEIAEAVIDGRFKASEAKRAHRALNALADICFGRYHGRSRALDNLRARLLGEEVAR
jgi:hypothetical protein